jgi:hypothetical protein
MANSKSNSNGRSGSNGKRTSGLKSTQTAEGGMLSSQLMKLFEEELKDIY